MALALNVFQTIPYVVPTSQVGIYTAPVGYTGVVLLAQTANIGSETHTVSFSHERSVAGTAVTTEILKNLVKDNSSIGLIFGSHYIAKEVFQAFEISFDNYYI